jgi:F-type H+-transporting ATPase subunit gamma
MAQNLQLLKRRIKTSKNISQIAKALEMIAAAKIKRAQNATQSNKPYADEITNLTRKIIGAGKKEGFSHPYLEKRLASKNLLISFSPDRGLCGSLNTNIYKKLIEMDNKDTKVVTVGKKAALFASKLSFELLLTYPMGNALPDYTIVYELKRVIDEEIKTGNVGTVSILYPDFVSLFTQTPIVKQLLPLQLDENVELAEDNISIIEPGRNIILEELLPYYLEVQLYNALLVSFTSQQAAQMVAMQNAKNNASDIAEYLNLVYNKSRQERITNEILDLSNSTQI